MNARITSRINMTNTVIDLVNTYSARFYVIPVFEAIFDAIVGRQSTVNVLLPTANDKTKDYRIARDGKITNLANASVEVCNPTRAYAVSISDDILLGEMKWTVTELGNVKIDEIESTCQNIYDKAYAVRVAAAPFNLTAGMLSSLNTEIPIWHDWVTAVRTRQVSIKTAKADVAKNVNENEKIMKNQLDYMVQSLSTSDPEIVALWVNSRKIIDPPTTNTQSLVTVLDQVTGLPMYEAQVRFVLGTKTYLATTNSLGEALIKPMKEGKYNVTITALGYQTYTKLEERVYRGRINRFTVELMPTE